MKQLLLIFVFLFSGTYAYSATTTRPTARASARTSASTSSMTSPSATSGRTSRVATTTKTVSSRSAATPTVTSSNASRGRSATTTAARAGSKQNVISTGTKVASAAQNTIVDEVCWSKFSGCMDSFCMLDNANGGRCICSDQNAEYDEILAEIQELDNQSYQMATVGVERLEMGEDADAIMSKTDEVTKKITADSTKSKRQSLDLSSWNVVNVDFDADVEDIFSLSSDGNSITNKTGDALYRASAKLCNEQIPECASQSTMMDLMYKQRVRSDCTAYENSLRQQRTQSAQKLASAQSAMREAALEQYRIANKYDLGQCTVAFKQCMQTTGGCGDDFTGCVTQQTTRDTLLSKNGTSKAPKQKKIQGASTTIEIAAWTYDALESKKPLCMNVTQQCVNVRDQVWDTFLREVAPAVKSAELMAESNLRTSCVSTISNCFQKACKDNIDPNDPDSYDACLTNPDVFEDLCKVEIEPCTAINENIMEYVHARLSSMRVDSCTREFKSCLQSEDRCGEDYTQCVGLDTDTIVNMCPVDKLPGCKYKTDTTDTNEIDVYKNLSEIAMGIFLNIDNNILAACQKAANSAMLKVCGSTTDCDDLIVDENIGARSLEYGICKYEPGTVNENTFSYEKSNCYPDASLLNDNNLDTNAYAGVISGTIDWDSLDFNEDGKLDSLTYWKLVETNRNGRKETYMQTKREDIDSELSTLIKNVDLAIQTIESDETVHNCIHGRTFQGRGQTLVSTANARFPQLTSQMRRIIGNSAIQIARDNYYKKYDELNAKMLQDYVTIGERINRNTRKTNAQNACMQLAGLSSLAVSSETPRSDLGTIIGVPLAVAGIVAIPFTFGASAIGAVAAAAGVMTGITMSTSSGSGNNSAQDEATCDNSGLVCSAKINQWNYQETITTTFNTETISCHKCVRITNCSKTKTPLNGEKYCEEWEEPTETCDDIQF